MSALASSSRLIRSTETGSITKRATLADGPGGEGSQPGWSSIDRELAFWGEEDTDGNVNGELGGGGKDDGGDDDDDDDGSERRRLGSTATSAALSSSNANTSLIHPHIQTHTLLRARQRSHSHSRSPSPTTNELNLLQPFSHTQNRKDQVAQRAWIRSPDSVMLHQAPKRLHHANASGGVGGSRSGSSAAGGGGGERVEQGYRTGKMVPFTTQNVTSMITTTRKGMGVMGVLQEMLGSEGEGSNGMMDSEEQVSPGDKRGHGIITGQESFTNKRPRAREPTVECVRDEATSNERSNRLLISPERSHPRGSTSRLIPSPAHTSPRAQSPSPASALAPQAGSSNTQLARTETETTIKNAKNEKDRNRFLAGASVNKAGVGGAKGRSPEEINKIISEASKGSAFFKREMLKEKSLSERCAALMIRTKQVMATANIARLEAEFDAEVAKVEAGRDLTQTIVHVDLDAFYAMVEVKRDPTLKGKCFGVGSGVLTTASYEARAYGCRSGMAGFVAKQLCPHLEFVKPNFALYSEASKAVKEVLTNYGIVAMAGMDEGYINITEYMASHNMSAFDVVSDLRAAVEHATGLTISAGISPCRMLSKIASDYNKPDGQFELEFTAPAIKRFMRDLPIRKIPGIGRVAERYIQALGVETCGDVYKHRATLMAMKESVDYLIRAYLGIGSNLVEPATRDQRKSVGCERTFRTLSKDEDILQMLEEIAEDLAEDMKRTRYLGRTVTVKYKMSNYNVYSRARSLSRYISTAEEILPIARALLIKELPLTLRLLGIRFSNLLDTDNPPPLNPFLKKSPTEVKGGHDTATVLSDGEDGTSAGASDQENDAVENEPDVPGMPRKPTCPLCSVTLPDGWAAINQHVDSCLGRDAEAEDDDDYFEIIEVRSTKPVTLQKSVEQPDRIRPKSAPRKVSRAVKPKDAFTLMMKQPAAKTARNKRART